MEDYLGLDIWWQGEGKARTLDRELLRTFSSMFSSRGLPDKKAVEDYLQLDVWWQEGKTGMRTTRSEVAAYFFLDVPVAGGCPDKKAVEEYLAVGVLAARGKGMHAYSGWEATMGLFLHVQRQGVAR